MRILILDNYDSFTFNLFHYCKQFCEEVEVHRNDSISLEEVDNFDKIVLSPGPGLPQDAGIMMGVIYKYYQTKPILGVCLGMQGMAEYFGARLHNLPEVLHGVQTQCIPATDAGVLFRNIDKPFSIGHYHSWVVDGDTIPDSLRITARNEKGLVMALEHTKYKLTGVQFHPESLLTEKGLVLIENWVSA